MIPILEIKNVSKQYKNFKAVDDLSFTVYNGDVFGFLGPNGAGKSTTIRMMLSLIYPSSGEILIYGKNIKEKRSEIMKNVGCIVEKPDFYLSLSALKNLEILGKMQHADTSPKKLIEILELVGLQERANSKVKTFSQGMKQRLGIAQALLHNPSFIILDEPTNGLDPQGMRDIREMIIKLNKEFSKTILLSSHILSEVEAVANRMVIINNGKKIVEGNVKDILYTGLQHIRFEVKNPEKAIASMQHSSIQNLFQHAENSNLVFYTERDKVPEINRFLVNQDVEILNIQTMRTIEEYFLSLTDT